MRIDSSGNVGIDHQQTTKKKGTILRLSLSNLKVLEVYIKMNSIYIPTILVYMIANCNTYSHFIHRLIHTEKTSKYLFKKAGRTAKFPPTHNTSKDNIPVNIFYLNEGMIRISTFFRPKKKADTTFYSSIRLNLFSYFNLVSTSTSTISYPFL